MLDNDIPIGGQLHPTTVGGAVLLGVPACVPLLLALPVAPAVPLTTCLLTLTVLLPDPVPPGDLV